MLFLRKVFTLFVLLAVATGLILSCTHFGFVARTPAGVRVPAKPTVLIGNIPGAYLNKQKNKFFLGYITISSNRIITAMGELDANTVSDFSAEQKKDKTVITLLQPHAKTYDAIYPGLLNLHNHTKQNVLPTWTAAKGQFQNRFEWRDWGNYKKSVSQNMNPWIGYGAAMSCAAFRWSNLQNMINGTIFLQGPSSCINGFGIYKVEDSSAYVSTKAAVQAPTDLIYPNEMSYVWNVLKKDIDAGKTYEEALFNDIRRNCCTIKKGIDNNIEFDCAGTDINTITAENINTPKTVKILSNKKLLENSCKKNPENLHPKFVRYVYFIHKTIAGKKEYIKSNKYSAIIAHLAEGRRKDPYNQTEYQLIKLLGLNKPYVNFIHGVGLRGDGIAGNDPADPIDKNDDYLDLAKNKMGLIWSPYSNLLLYGETLDIEAAHRAGVLLSIGSDWVPTGTKSVLEEIKLAARYVDRTLTKDKKIRLNKIFTDEYLYKMMTENSAKMINHWGLTTAAHADANASNANVEAGVGQLTVGAMGSVIAVSIMDLNPYTNLVRKATEREINLVVVDGNPIYGNINYLEQAAITNSQYEVFSNEIAIADQAAVEGIVNAGILKPDLAKLKIASTEEAMTDAIADAAQEPFFNQLAKEVFNYKEKISRKDSCQFSVAKAFVTPDTKNFEKAVDKFTKETGLDLDKVADIQLLLAVSSLTQSLNRLSPKDGDPKFALGYFPNLYTCSDLADKQSHRYQGYVRSDGNDELQKNSVEAVRATNRKGVPKTAESLAQQYGLKFEVK